MIAPGETPAREPMARVEERASAAVRADAPFRSMTGHRWASRRAARSRGTASSEGPSPVVDSGRFHTLQRPRLGARAATVWQVRWIVGWRKHAPAGPEPVVDGVL